jgi:N-acetylglucosamine-6-sulfatase
VPLTTPPGGRGRRWHALAVAGVAAVALVGGILVADRHSVAEPALDGPNVVVIMTDDQEVASLRAMEQTQRLLADEGMRFSRHYATFPLCCPSRASYLTGQYAHNHGVQSNRPPEGGYPAFDDSGTVAVALERAGYRTAWIGKFLNGYPSVAREHPEDVPAGFDRWYGELTGRVYNWLVNDDGETQKIERSGTTYQTDVYAEKAAEFIEASAANEQAFFMTVATLAPHGEPTRKEYPDPRPARRHKGEFQFEPFPKVASFDERRVGDKPSFVRDEPRLNPFALAKLRDRYRARLASLLAVDDLVARIFATLESTGELDETYVMFTSDNGYLMGEHRMIGKTLLYEESVRVPLLLRGPGIRAGGVHGGATANVDLAPTIYDITGIRPLTEPDGVSLLPVARRGARGDRRWVLLENQRSAGVTDGRWVYLEHEPDGIGMREYELYDLRSDPRELRNLSLADAARASPQELERRPELRRVRDRLAARLDALRGCEGTRGPNACD